LRQPDSEVCPLQQQTFLDAEEIARVALSQEKSVVSSSPCYLEAGISLGCSPIPCS